LEYPLLVIDNKQPNWALLQQWILTVSFVLNHLFTIW